MGNTGAAIKAERALIAAKAADASAEDHASLAELLIIAAGGYVSPEAEAELMAALQLDPANGTARYYAGLMFAQLGRPDRTYPLWYSLLAEGPAEAPWMEPIKARIAEIAAAAGVAYDPPATGGAPSQADISAAAQMAPADRRAMIEGMVANLSDRLARDGGPVEDGARLITSLSVLGETEKARAVNTEARQRFAGQPAALSVLQAAAKTAGIPE